MDQRSQVSSDGQPVRSLIETRKTGMERQHKTLQVRIPSDASQLEGTLTVPADAIGIVLFAHGRPGPVRTGSMTRTLARFNSCH